MWNLRTAESAQAVFAITLVCALVFLSTDIVGLWAQAHTSADVPRPGFSLKDVVA
jgi:hypothetical protein